jgi:hypothetical protein
MTLQADNRLAEAPMTMVRCKRCAAGVLVRKSSWNQTSLQWDAAASAGCIERTNAQRVNGYGGRALFLACSALADSITDAVRRGQLPIVDENPSATT